MGSMTCPLCRAEAPEGSRYCPNCANPLAPTGTPPRPSRAGPSRWTKILIAALAISVLAGVAVAVYLVVGVGKASDTLNNALVPRPGRPPGYEGPAYPGMLVQDRVATSAGGSVELDGETLTAGPLTRTPTLLGPTLCSQVTLANHAAATREVGAQEWKLQQPNGIVETFVINGTLQGGQLAPGGSAMGTVCFSDNRLTGTFVLLWQPVLAVGRGAWLFPI